MTLREKQSEFARCIGILLGWIAQKGWAVTLAEGSVMEKRKVRLASGPAIGMDLEHMTGSLHYLRLAQDLNLFVDGHLISDGSHPAWKSIGAFWKGLNQDSAWGGDFEVVDSNHFSFAHGGKK